LLPGNHLVHKILALPSKSESGSPVSAGDPPGKVAGSRNQGLGFNSTATGQDKIALPGHLTYICARRGAVNGILFFDKVLV